MYSPPNRAVLPSSVDEDQGLEQNEKETQQHFEEFYEDIFYELHNYGKLEEINVCDNIGPHLIGNVYVKFRHEEDAAKAIASLAGRFYAGKPIAAEFSPVTDFREACCRQYDFNECTRGGECNFMHLRAAPTHLYKRLFGRAPRQGRGRDHDADYDRRHRSRSRSRSRSRRRSRSRSRSRKSRSRSRSRRSRSRSRSRSRGRDRYHRSTSSSHHRSRSSRREESSHGRKRERDRDENGDEQENQGTKRVRERDEGEQENQIRNSDRRDAEN